jgi:hypothetical protein
MAHGGTSLVALTAGSTARRAIPGAAPDAGFISQLIAERDRLPPQREKRQAPVTTAISAYDQGERRDARRVPQGFFRSAEA